MKNKSIITILSLCLGLSMATTSCDDMLTSGSDRHSYEVAGDTLYSYWGILKSLQNIGERYVILGECRGDLIDGGEFTTDSVNAILSFGLNGDTENFKDGANRYLKVSDYYHIINSCNAYLAKVDTLMEKADGERYMLREYAQVEAIRAWTYMQLVVNYGDVPFYLEPMLATNVILGFDSKNPANRVNASNLWEKLESKLMRAYQIEEQWGYPQYNEYGFTTTVCHSSKVMFPASLVLADIYLMGNQYEKAASYYYEFLDGKYGGALPMDYYSYALLRPGADAPEVTNEGYPWTEKGAASKTTEAITAIPSSTNSLWGMVQRGVNDLYGFEASISQNTGSDSIARASIRLSKNWERQLGPSAGYDTLRLAQKFEVYIKSEEENIEGLLDIEVIDSVGDARGIAGKDGMGYISRLGSGDYYIDEDRTERYIMKQNPGKGGDNYEYSTVFPMVYRKSMVWLRFAEALNRAGYPGYAFAILKNGLTRNTEWLPSAENDFAAKKYRAHYVHSGIQFNEDGTPKVDANGAYIDTVIVIPSDWETNDLCVITGEEYDIEAFSADTAAFAKYLRENYASHIDTVADPIQYVVYQTEEYANFQPKNTAIVCDYISREEYEKAKGVIWLDFNKSQFAGIQNAGINYVRNYPLEKNTFMILATYPTSMPTNEYITRGIHQKGCGLLKYNEKRSKYNYVDQINLKLEAAGKTALTKAEIYDAANQADVIEAIEELILDEAGLELAFEGNRFFDLMRVANRKANPGKFMAEKIGARSENASSWAAGLESDIKNWYLPLPDYSYRK